MEPSDNENPHRSWPVDRRRAAARRDGGFTIVENLMAILLTGLIATSLFMAMWTLIRVARVNDYQAEVEAVVGGAVDALATVDYQPCPGLGGYEEYAQQGAAAIGWPTSTVSVTRVRYWDPYTATWDDVNPFSSDECSGTVFLSTARTMQLVEVTATSPDGQYSRSVQTIVTDLRNRRLGDA